MSDRACQDLWLGLQRTHVEWDGVRLCLDCCADRVEREWAPRFYHIYLQVREANDQKRFKKQETA